jgi:hypothetical protein
MSITDNFIIEGFYYTLDNYKFRKFLDIKHVNTNLNSPDIMVVMMNPGSSKPVNDNDNGCTLTVAIPDRTQDQIMKVMLNTGYQYARILNLSDLRTPDSNELYQFLRSKEVDSIPHSIFCSERAQDFNALFISNIPIIYGWGVNASLQDLAEQALVMIDANKPSGVLKKNTLWAYYHPLPPVYSKQAAWVNQVSDQLKK